MESGVSENAVSGHIQLIIPGETACFAVCPYTRNVLCYHCHNVIAPANGSSPLLVCSSFGGGSKHWRKDPKTRRRVCCQLTNNHGRGCRYPGAKCPQVSPYIDAYHQWNPKHVKFAIQKCWGEWQLFVFQVSVKVWNCQLLSGLQRHARLLPHHGHESQPPV